MVYEINSLVIYDYIAVDIKIWSLCRYIFLLRLRLTIPSLNSTTLDLNFHIFFNLPLSLFLSILIVITTLNISASYLHKICSNHLNLFSIFFSQNVCTLRLSRMYSFFILSSPFTPLIYLSILISATLIFYFVLLSTVQHIDSYSIIGFTTIL